MSTLFSRNLGGAICATSAKLAACRNDGTKEFAAEGTARLVAATKPSRRRFSGGPRPSALLTFDFFASCAGIDSCWRGGRGQSPRGLSLPVFVGPISCGMEQRGTVPRGQSPKASALWLQGHRSHVGAGSATGPRRRATDGPRTRSRAPAAGRRAMPGRPVPAPHRRQARAGRPPAAGPGRLRGTPRRDAPWNQESMSRPSTTLRKRSPGPRGSASGRRVGGPPCGLHAQVLYGRRAKPYTPPRRGSCPPPGGWRS